MRVAIMQPAFIPPASYFRLFAATDLFIVYDDVQFNRRWYTHRQQLTNTQGNKMWMSLPVKNAPRDTTLIKDMEWADNKDLCWGKMVRKFPIFTKVNRSPEVTATAMLPQIATPLGAIMSVLAMVRDRLEIPTPFVYASQFNIPSAIRGQDRILELCKVVKATEYVNSPGGKDLYNEATFYREGVRLYILPEYRGNRDSVIERFGHGERFNVIKKEIYANS